MYKIMKMTGSACVLLFVICYLQFAISGCSPITVSEEQKKQILAVDPDFKKTLEIKDATDAKLADLRAEFLSEKNIHQSKVTALRKEFEAKKAQFHNQTQEIKSQLDSQRQKISTEIAIVTGDLKNKNKSYQAIKGMLNQAKAIIEGKFGHTFSEKDRLEWQKRFQSLAEEFKSITQDIALLKEKLYILRLKQRSLIQ